MLTFLRRRGLGSGSIKGMVGFLEEVAPESVSALAHKGDNVCVVRNDKLSSGGGQGIRENTEWLVRWGCTSGFGLKDVNTINVSKAIKQVGDKAGFRRTVMYSDRPELAPKTIFSLFDAAEITYPVIVRPRVHAQGKNLWKVGSSAELCDVIKENKTLQDGWYASEYINKVAEYRVYVVSGRVVTIANKIPDNYEDIAWNVAQGGKFEVVKFGDWGMDVVRVAIESFNLTDLDFGGVDIMVDEDGKAYLIEINSAPSLPIMVEGKVSYRQQCMAKAFKYLVENGKDRFSYGTTNWKHCIHPAISDKAIL